MRGTKRLALAALLCAVATVGSVVSFPAFFSRCAPVQHAVNLLCAVLLGPGWGVCAAFGASLLRFVLGLGSLLAFPGSMIGALLSGLLYRRTRSLLWAAAGEVLGTGVIGALCAYPVARLFMGKAADLAFYVYITPFMVSTIGGTLLALLLLYALRRSGALREDAEPLRQNPE